MHFSIRKRASSWRSSISPGPRDYRKSSPSRFLLDEEAATLQIANDHGFRHFTSVDAFKRYVETDVLALDKT